MAETMADKAKKQRASKVKGLHEGVGKFKGKKSLNLRDKQLGKKGRAAAKKRTVSISDTSHNKKTGIVTGPAKKPLTGKVDMGGGNMAVYRNGKRVLAKPAGKKNDKGGSGGGANRSGNPPKGTGSATPPADPPLTPAQKKAARVAKRIAAAPIAARKVDTARRKTGTAKTTTLKDLKPPNASEDSRRTFASEKSTVKRQSKPGSPASEAKPKTKFGGRETSAKFNPPKTASARFPFIRGVYKDATKNRPKAGDSKIQTVPGQGQYHFRYNAKKAEWIRGTKVKKGK
jgi:hypothetical protein